MRRLHGDRESFEWAASEYLRMSGVYWGATAMALLGRLGEMDREGILDEVAACQVAGSGGFARHFHMFWVVFSMFVVRHAV